MKPTLERIMQHQLNQIHAEVIMTAYSESKPGWIDQRSEPNFYRFCYTDRGQAWLDMNNERYIVKPGTLYFLPAGTNQAFGTDGDELFGRYWCHFRMDLGDVQFIQSLKLPPFVQVDDAKMMKQLFDKMVSYQDFTSITRVLRLKGVLLELLAYYLDASQVQQVMENNLGLEVKWNEVITYIEANLHVNIQIEELAKFAYLHPNYFITSFTNIMGCSPIQYVTNRRIATAKQLLADTELSVSAVAKKVGLQNHYLSRLFKRYTGVTPVQYRRFTKVGVARMKDFAALSEEENRQ
ncbi:helix-turn-helix domain-containing protein [Paenibacillus sp. sgz302251]|uniref:helix-turn-helix domain-containing protein n=1 Tax=Paenibacillus sp. sgz302251 TaxID=3414493 RepID=UPI003C7ADD8F